MNPADYSALEEALEIMAPIGTTRRIRTGDLLITNESKGDHDRSRRNKTREEHSVAGIFVYSELCTAGAALMAASLFCAFSRNRI